MFFLGDPITQTSVCVRDSAIFISMMLGPAFDDVAYADQFCTGQLFYRLGVARGDFATTNDGEFSHSRPFHRWMSRS